MPDVFKHFEEFHKCHLLDQQHMLENQDKRKVKLELFGEEDPECVKRRLKVESVDSTGIKNTLNRDSMGEAAGPQIKEDL